jgi:hypothetical protein
MRLVVANGTIYSSFERGNEGILLIPAITSFLSLCMGFQKELT